MCEITKKAMASMGLKPKDAIAFARLHCTPTKGICQHLAQKNIFYFGQVDEYAIYQRCILSVPPER